MTGSSAARTTAMGPLLVPVNEEKGYKTSFAMGLTAASKVIRRRNRHCAGTVVSDNTRCTTCL
ncbi:TRAP transporter large permease subunit [Loktanella agnita]|uniref:TRAP transporter large permease subunit n=1 Tax=Loktanella agnita TaxID=287097 RepID=UPI0039889067